jgi:hypothetical protein
MIKYDWEIIFSIFYIIAAIAILNQLYKCRTG